ncbi:MAG: PIN domain-containing protein [Candidatus Hermodarchaeota archaeon]
MNKVVLPVVVDTNFMTIPAQFNVDIFAEAERVLERRFEFVILPSVADEIEAGTRESKGRGKRLAFRIARDLTRRCRAVETEKSILELPVDDQLLEYAIQVEGVLATNDRELRSRAREQGVPVLFLRGRKQLSVEGTLA